jgi:hypothetical protein
MSMGRYYRGTQEQGTYLNIDGGMITPAACRVSRSPWRTGRVRYRAALDRSSSTFNTLISFTDTSRE